MAKELIVCRQSFVSMQAIEWEILREKSPKLVRLGPAHVVQELSGHAKRIQEYIKSVFQG
jgi:hypothetical protein